MKCPICWKGSYKTLDDVQALGEHLQRVHGFLFQALMDSFQQDRWQEEAHAPG